MSLTPKQIYDLNNMNVASQNAQMGTLLNNLIEGGSGGGDAYIEISGKTPQQVVDACISTVESGGTPWLVGVFGMIYKLDTYNPDNGVLIFSHNEIEVGGGIITYFGLKALAYYKEEGTWTFEAGTKNIIV